MPEQDVDMTDYQRYVSELYAPEDEALRAAREEMDREGLPPIFVSPSEGKLLHQMALVAGARRILEIGTLGGYSAIWLARALPPEGMMISLELDPHHAEVARRNITRAGLSERVEVRVGPASETLAAMASSGLPAFDLVFIDADKDGYPAYLDLAFPLLRVGGLILADNTLSPGVLEPDADTGIARYNAAVAAHPGLSATIIPIVRRHVNGLSVAVKTHSAG